MITVWWPVGEYMLGNSRTRFAGHVRLVRSPGHLVFQHMPAVNSVPLSGRCCVQFLHDFSWAFAPNNSFKPTGAKFSAQAFHLVVQRSPEQRLMRQRPIAESPGEAGNCHRSNDNAITDNLNDSLKVKP